MTSADMFQYYSSFAVVHVDATDELFASAYSRSTNPGYFSA